MSDFNQEAENIANKINRTKAKVDWWCLMNAKFTIENPGLAEEFQSLINDITTLDISSPKLMQLGYELNNAIQLDDDKLILFKSEIKKFEKRLNAFKKSFTTFMSKAKVDFQFD
ncbi:hypothetical protein [Scytonema hofmannii]|nr:hypothetical protein [Scytonema hofmannii]